MFRNWVFDNFPFLEDDFDALTDYELFCKICSYVKEYSKDNEEMKAKILEFQHYFDNLDVQEEINNKLDEMAESGQLDEIINQNIFEDLNNKIDNNKVNQLIDNVQSSLYGDLETIFGGTSDWGVSMCFIKDIENHTYGIIGANDYTSNNPENIERFNLRTFNYDNGIISNITERATSLPGHVNSVADIGNNKILICASPNFYIYDLLNNTYTTINNPLNSGWINMIANDNEGNIYGCQDYDYDTSTVINRFYNLTVDNVNDTLVVDSFKTIPDLRNYLQGNEQGMVIYNDLLIFPSFSNNKLCIYDFKSLKYIKTQLIVAPYETEYEDGFIYNNKLLMIDSYGRLLEPDIYGKNVIGGYTKNNIARSNTNISLIDNIIKLRAGEYVDLDFSKYLNFLIDNSNTDIGSLGSKLESITIYLAVRTFDTSGGVHNLQPIEIPLYKNISYSGDTISWFACHWQTNYTELSGNNIERTSYFGTYSFVGSSVIPKLRFTFNEKYLQETFNTTDNTNTWNTTPEGYKPTIYITKIIGHKKVGLGY